MKNLQRITEMIFGSRTFKSTALLALYTLLLLIISPSSFSQTGVVGEEEVVIYGTRKNELPPANRNFEKVNYEIVQPAMPTVKYTGQDVDIRLPKLDTKMKILTVKGGELPKLYGNYVKAGFGNYTTPYLEGFFSNKRSDKGTIGLHLMHLSSQNGPVAKSLSGVSNSSAEAYGKYFAGAVTLKGSLGYSRNRYNYYGFNTELPYSKDSLKQVYGIFHGAVGLESNNLKSPFAFNYNLGFYNLSASAFDKATESEIILTGGISYKIDAEKSISSTSMLSYSDRKDTSNISRVFYQIKPTFNFVRDQLIVRGGFNVAYTNDTLAGKVHIYPTVFAEYSVVPKMFSVFAGMEGEMQKNTLRQFVYQNPYLNTNTKLLHTNKTIDLYGGIKGSIMKRVDYRAKISYATYKNLYFFNNGLKDTSRFEVFYAPDNSSILNFSLKPSLLEGGLNLWLTGFIEAFW